MKNIEAEKDELVLQNESGTYAIIPANKREEVKRLLSEGCYDCIDRIVESLPRASDYAQDGSLFPGWDKVKSTLNPYNWGVKDYTDKYSDKDAAFSAARKAGEKEYLYNGIRYTTDIKGEDRAESSFNLDRAERVRIYNSVNPSGYPLEELKDALRRYITNEKAKDDPTAYTNYLDTADYDAWAFYMGVPQSNNSITKSKYKPSVSKDPNKSYYTIRKAYPNFEDKVLNDANNMFNRKGRDAEYYKDDDTTYGVLSDDGKKVTGRTNFYPLENAQYSKGEDERGKYIALYDVYDFSIPFEGKIGQPYEIYDRIYYKDYGNGKEAPMYYTDKELSELDPNKKNFDTLALQRELSNRGYKLTRSTKKDFSFDGVWGEETKSALLDYQSKNNKIKAADGLVIDPPADIDIKLLNTIGTIESNNQYDILFGGKRNPQLTDMSISELLDYQSNLINEQKKLKKTNPDQYVGSAAGRYQFIPNTIKGLVDLGIISLDDKFNSETQDKMAIQLLNESGLNRYKKGELSADEFADNLSKKWAGLPYNNDKSYYNKDGVNKALISRKDFMAVFADEINNDIAKQEAIQEEVIQEAVQEESASKLPVISLQEDDLSDYGIKNDVLQPITQDTMQKLLNPTELVTEIAEPEPSQLSIPDEVKSGLMSMLIQMKYISPGEKLTTDTLKMFVYENLQNLGNFPTDDQSLALITTELNK